MPMKQAEINKLCSLVGHCGYNDTNKREFRRLGMKLLREVNTSLGLNADVRYNAGGIAVSGDCTLHADNVYVSFNADGVCGLGIMFRKCKGRKDYTGERNNWYGYEKLQRDGVAGLSGAVARLLSPVFTPVN